MNLNKLATIFESKAQVLPMGTSEPSADKNKLMAFKDEIMKAYVQPRPGWSNPGQTAMKVIEKLLKDEMVSSDEKHQAVNDVRTNYRGINDIEFTSALGL